MVNTKFVKVDKETAEISCDGGGTSGHPTVYYTFENRKEVMCEYCGTIFTKKTRKTAIKTA